jgi:hypothetical protein
MASISTTTPGWREHFDLLPVPDGPFFRALWREARLQYDGRSCGDLVDEFSAHLIAAAQTKRTSLFVVLPDRKIHRAAFLFTNALLNHWWQARQDPTLSKKRPLVLYFGSHIGIRQQLQLVTFNGFDLSSVFELSHLGRRGRSDSQRIGLTTDVLAEVVTIYAPASPQDVIDETEPDLILLDLADTTDCQWLETVLSHANKKNVPVLGWGTNSLSECVAPFAKQIQAFVWPMSSFFNQQVPAGTLYLERPQERSIRALVLAGSEVDEVAALFRRIYGLLLKASGTMNGLFSRRAAAVHWSYLRMVENMCVPGDLYESESQRYWGLRSVQSASDICARFREEHPPSAVIADLELAATLTGEVWEKIQKAPPLWNALLNLCFDDGRSNSKVIRFSGRARKQMFLLAILAHHNITEQDLKDVDIEVLTLDDPAPDYEHDAVVPGLPSVHGLPRFTSFFEANEGQFVLFPHQLRGLDARIEDMKSLLTLGPEMVAMVLGRLAGSNEHVFPPRERNVVFFNAFQVPLRITAPKEISAVPKGGVATPRLFNAALIQPDSTVEELRRLLEPSETDEESDTLGSLDEYPSDIVRKSEESPSGVCTEVIGITFRENCRVNFSTDTRVQVVSSALNRTSLQERYASSLRPNDRLLYIEGQKRQNLYDLILSRVHTHPAFRIHLALIRRWQDDLRLAYKSREETLSTDEILGHLQDRGSHIVTTLTVRNWLNGLCLCPDDPEDLRRLAEIMNLGFVTDQYRKIHKAAQRIRGLHIGLGLRLCGWLEGAANGSDDENEVFDQELGLTFADFKTSLVVLTVRSVKKLDGFFLRSELGTLQYGQETN